MRLAVFDLDNTLLAGDSDYLWGRYLVEQGVVERVAYERENQRFYDEYKAGTLDIEAFCHFSFAPLAAHDLPTLLGWRDLPTDDRLVGASAAAVAPAATT